MKLIEITDPFAEDFGLKTSYINYTGKSVKEVLADLYGDLEVFFKVNWEDTDCYYILKDSDVLLCSFGVHGKHSLMLVATLAVLALAAWATPVITGLAAGEAWGATEMVVFGVINLAGNYLISALLAPDIPDNSSDGLDKSKAYLWSGQSNTSKQMIPIPVVFGKFRLAGNLINSHTESYNVQKAGYSIQDTIYLDYALTSNELSSIENCLINDTNASEFDETDRSIYYTLGTDDQLPLNSSTSLALYTGETAVPATSGILFPSLVEETNVNLTLTQPSHMYSESTTTSEVNCVGTLLDVEAVLSSPLLDTETGTISISLDHGNVPSSGFIKISTKTDYVSDFSYKEETIEFDSGTSTTLNIVNRGDIPISFNSGSTVTFFTSNTKTITIPNSLVPDNNGTWHPSSYEKPTFTSTTVSVTTSDDIIIQLVFPDGLYTATDNGHYKSRWVAFDFQITSNGITESYTAPRKLPSEMTATESKYCLSGKFLTSQFIEYSIVDIITDINPSSALLTSGKLTKGHSFTIQVRIGEYGYNNKYFAAWSPSDKGHVDYTKVILTRTKAIRYDTVLNYPYTSHIGLVLNATPTINNRLPLVQCDVKCNMYVYNSGTDNKYEVSSWTKEFTENPAYHAINLLYNSLWGAGIGGDESSTNKDSKFAELVDIDKFIELAEYSDDLVVYESGESAIARYTFNGIFDSQINVWKALQIILGSANAVPVFDGNKITVYYEKEETTITQIFSSSNIEPGSFTESFIKYEDLAECVSGNFCDINAGYAKTSIIYMNPSADPKKVKNIELYGIVDSVRALEKLKYKLKKNAVLTRLFKFTVADSSAIAAQVGELVGIQYEFIDFETSNDMSIAGRVSNVDINTKQITLDRLIDEITNAILLIRTNETNIYTWTVDSWDNTNNTTILTLTSDTNLSEVNNLDTYLVGGSSELYKEMIITSLNINEDLSVDVEGIIYDSTLFEGFTGITINSALDPLITKEEYKVNNLTATHDKVNQLIKLNWSAPLKTDLDIIRYLIYRKIGTNTYNYIASTFAEEFTDLEINIFDQITYKVLPVFNYKGVEASVPLGWSDTSNTIEITHQLFEYLIAPDFSVSLTNNIHNDSLVDINISIVDPNDWEYKDAREGFNIWVRTNDTDDISDWFGPTNITLSSAASSGASSISVNSISGLPLDSTGSHVYGLIIINSSDLVFVTNSSGTGPYTLTLHTTNISDKFSLTYNHESGESVYNAHKGFFPIRYFGTKSAVDVYEELEFLTCSNIYKYDIKTNYVLASQQFNTNEMNSNILDYRYVDGFYNTVFTIKEATSDSLKISSEIIPSDFTVNLAYRDITGTVNKLYPMFWGLSPYGGIDIDSSGNLIGSVIGYSDINKYCWVGVNRLYYNFPVNEEKKNSYGWTSHIKPVLT